MEWRRRYERVQFFCPLQVTVLKDGVTIQGSALDISIGGVGLTASVSLERGQPVRVRFYLDHEENGAVEDVMGQVAYMRSDEDGNRIGIEFFETLKDATHPLIMKKLMKI